MEAIQTFIDNNMFKQVYKQSNDPMLIMKGHCFIDCNQAAATIFQLKNIDDIRKMHPSEISPEYQPDGILSYIKAEQLIALCYEKGVYRFPWLHQNKFSESFWVEVTIVDITINSHNYILCTLRSINGYQKLISSLKGYNLAASPPDNNLVIAENFLSTTEDSIQNYKLLNEHKKAIDASSVVSKTTTDGVITYVNDMFCDVSGYSASELLGKKHSVINHPDMPKSVFKEMWSTILSGNIWQGTLKNRKKSGDEYYVFSTISPIKDINGDIKEFIAIRYDVSDMYEKNVIIKDQNTDQITQLNNITKLLADIKDNEHCLLALIEIKELTSIQEVYDFNVFNNSTIVVANFLRDNIPKAINIYRCNDNTFALLVKEGFDITYLEKQSQYIQNSFEQGLVKVDDNEFLMSMKIGIAEKKQCGNVYFQAQCAVKHSVEKIQATTVYSEKLDIHKQLMEAIVWSKKLKSAISNNKIAIFGQKLFDNKGNLYSTEVLMRYFDTQENSYVSPFFFLAHAIKAQLYTKLSLSIITQAFAYFSMMHRQPFSINLTMDDIKDKTMANWILKQIKFYDFGELLTIELVESTDYELDNGKILNFLNQIKMCGCKIAIDDFGSGYSNFEYLMRLPIDIIKIDGSLIKNINVDEKSLGIVKTLVQFSKAMQLKVTAEYVENKDIFETLKTLGIDYFQGYHFHKPELLK